MLFKRYRKATCTSFSNTKSKFETYSQLVLKISASVALVLGTTRSRPNECETRKSKSFLGSLPIRLMSDALQQDSIRQKPFSLVRYMGCLAQRLSPAFSKTCSKVLCTQASTPINTNTPSDLDVLFSITIILT